MVYKWFLLSGEGEAKASQKAERFLHMIEDPERRVYYAEKLKNYDVAMDVSMTSLATNHVYMKCFFILLS